MPNSAYYKDTVASEFESWARALKLKSDILLEHAGRIRNIKDDHMDSLITITQQGLVDLPSGRAAELVIRGLIKYICDKVILKT